MEWSELTATGGLLVGFGFLIKYLTTDLTSSIERLEGINIKLIDAVNGLKDYIKENLK